MIALLLAATPALALTPAWGVGPKIGTSVLPSGYPLAFPPRVLDYDLDGDGERDDLNGDGKPEATTLAKVRGDLSLGAQGYVWTPSGAARGGLSADLDLGKRFVQGTLLVTVDRSWDAGAATLILGGGMGFQSARWKGEDADERLRIPSYPVRLQLGVVTPVNDFIAFEAKLFSQLAVPLRHTYFDVLGQQRDVNGTPFAYLSFGLEVSALYGLFR